MAKCLRCKAGNEWIEGDVKPEVRSDDLLSGVSGWDEAALNLLCDLTGGPAGVETGRAIGTKERIESIKKYLKAAYDMGKKQAR